MLARVLFTTATAALMATAAAADYRITILHTNDFHARFEPISRYDSTCSEESNQEGSCFGGSARLATAAETAKARAVNPILVDGGDQFQGTLFYTYYKGAAAAEMMNRMGYDAMTVGNHEFDDGPEVLRDFVNAVEFPILMSNADISGEPILSDAIQKSVVIERGGERIGLIGLTPQDTDEISSPGDNVIFTDPVDAVQSEVDRLTEQGINKIIVLSHSGFDTDIRVAENTTGVDVIVGGHDNTLMSNIDPRAEAKYPHMVGDTAIVQAYAYGKYLGELNVVFDDEGVIISATGEPILLDAFVTEDDEVKSRVGELAEPLEELRNEVVGVAGAPIDGDRANCRYRECEMGNLVADAMLQRVKDQGIQIAIANGGGLRASIDEGDITMGEVYTVLPFQNTLATFQVTGATLKDALENAVRQYDNPDQDGRFAQVAGMKYTIDPSKPFGERISNIMIDEGNGFVPMEADKVYGVVSNNFVRNGGDGYSMFETAMNAYDFGPDLAEVLADYVADNAPVSPYTDGRITILE